MCRVAYRSWGTRHPSVVVSDVPQHTVVLWGRLKANKEEGDLGVVQGRGEECKDHEDTYSKGSSVGS